MGRRGGFLFFIFKKLKFQKYMSVLENFKNIHRSPYGGATWLKCNFFSSSNLQQSPWRKKKRGPVAPQRATGPCRPPQGRQASGPARGAGRPSCGRQGGPVAPPRATGSGRLYKASPSFPPLIWPQKIQKNPEKREGWEEGKRRSSVEFRTCDLPVTFV